MNDSIDETRKICEILNSIRKNEKFENCADFLEEGILDSFEMLTFIQSIEEFYGIGFEGEDIIPENFSNIEAVIGIVHKYIDK